MTEEQMEHDPLRMLAARVGILPGAAIEHIDGDPSNNDPANLRVVVSAHNAGQQPAFADPLDYVFQGDAHQGLRFRDIAGELRHYSSVPIGELRTAGWTDADINALQEWCRAVRVWEQPAPDPFHWRLTSGPFAGQVIGDLNHLQLTSWANTNETNVREGRWSRVDIEAVRRANHALQDRGEDRPREPEMVIEPEGVWTVPDLPRQRPGIRNLPATNLTVTVDTEALRRMERALGQAGLPDLPAPPVPDQPPTVTNPCGCGRGEVTWWLNVTRSEGELVDRVGYCTECMNHSDPLNGGIAIYLNQNRRPPARRPGLNQHQSVWVLVTRDSSGDLESSAHTTWEAARHDLAVYCRDNWTLAGGPPEDNDHLIDQFYENSDEETYSISEQRVRS